MKFKTIHSLGSRCQNSDILKIYNYRKFSGFFDFMNTLKIENILHILDDDFNELLKLENNYTLLCDQLTIDPETRQPLKTSFRTTNKFYDVDIRNVHGAIFPHHDLNSEKDYNHFINCKKRFKNLRKYNTLFNYTYNTWENPVSTNHMNKMVEILKDRHNMVNFKICFISLSFGESAYKKDIETTYYDVWSLSINGNSFTGGLFSKHIDNINYINIIKNYDINDIRVTKEEIDN